MGVTTFSGFEMKVFTREELQALHAATLEILWNTGIRVDSEKALEIFKPDLFDRRSREDWMKSGGADLTRRAYERAKWIIEQHEIESKRTYPGLINVATFVWIRLDYLIDPNPSWSHKINLSG